jgi:hypothetical protein
VFESRVLRTILQAKRDEVTGEWRKLHSEELHNLYSSPNIIRQIKSRGMKWDMWHAWERSGKCTGFCWEGKKERDHFEAQGVDGRMGSEWILGRLARGVEWNQLAQDRDRWRAVVNTVMNLRVLVPQN